jgi:hypothetical protein
MSQIMKAFTGIFMVLFLTTTSMGVLGAFLQVSRAQTFHASVIDELENSNYNKKVLEECLIAAGQNGYELTVTLYQTEGGYVVCHYCVDVPKEIPPIDMVRVDMGFTIEIPFFGVKNKQLISGYGR